MKKLSWLALIAVAALSASSMPFGVSAQGGAQEGAQEDAAESRSATFQAVEGSRGEQVPGGPLMVASYAVVMVLLLGYVARLGLLQRKTAADVERLSAAIQRARVQGK